MLQPRSNQDPGQTTRPDAVCVVVLLAISSCVPAMSPVATITCAAAAYTACAQKRQGISAGWNDPHLYNREGQSMQIRRVPDGFYVMRSIVDPYQRLRDLNRANDAAVVIIDVKGDPVGILGESDAGLVPSQNHK
jgi:hypothetical protein